ncbi:hypothetical protein A4R26_11915 [Niastella populi]|uniref:Uncharacterized protein n=1 Tax=Niastella populi TaxID=550983 RepID=A0A1V9GB26_9BACT|nr:hypothetical protein A4R26_11915 [Niastella populi]
MTLNKGTISTAMRLKAFQGFLCGTEPAGASGYHQVQVQNYSSAKLFYGYRQYTPSTAQNDLTPCKPYSR